MSFLAQKSCQACEGGIAVLEDAKTETLLEEIPGWEIVEGHLQKTFQFNNFHQTMAFINAMAWIAHGEDHHPDFEAGYKTCTVKYITHAVGGLTENDFICAAKINALRSSG